MKRYYIEVYDKDADEWVDCFPFDPEGIYGSLEAAEYQVYAMWEADVMHGKSHTYRIMEL